MPGSVLQRHGDPAPILLPRPPAETAPGSMWQVATPAIVAGSNQVTPLPMQATPLAALVTPLPRAPGGRSGPAQQAARGKVAGPGGAAGNPSGSGCGAPRTEARPARRSHRPGGRGRRAGNWGERGGGILNPGSLLPALELLGSVQSLCWTSVSWSVKWGH